MATPVEQNSLNELKATVERLTAELEKLTRKVNRLPTQATADAAKLVYAEAGNWVRMVNTITWTLSSIFLVASIIALGTAANPQYQGPWRGVIGIAIFGLSILWLVIDLIYYSTARAAGDVLVKVEATFGELQFYAGQAGRKYNRILVRSPVWLLPIGMGCFALMFGSVEILKLIDGNTGWLASIIRWIVSSLPTLSLPDVHSPRSSNS